MIGLDSICSLTIDLFHQAWVIWQLINSDAFFDRHNSFLRIHYETSGEDEYAVPHATSFHIQETSKLEGKYQNKELKSSETIVIQEFHGISVPWVCDPALLLESSICYKLPLWKCPQWPWVFATMSLLGETAESSAEMKLRHFLTLVRPIFEGGKHPIISAFEVPIVKRTNTMFGIKPEHFETWQSYVGKVIDY